MYLKMDAIKKSSPMKVSRMGEVPSSVPSGDSCVTIYSRWVWVGGWLRSEVNLG